MRENINYEKDTRLAYNIPKAQSYKQQQTNGISWIRFTTWREKSFVSAALRCCKLTNKDKIIDIPCGTGVLGNIFSNFPSFVIASDISREMMGLARKDYSKSNFGGFIQGDITMIPFKERAFHCVVVLGLMHRLPAGIRKQALKEVVSLSKRFIIVSYSIDSTSQRIKQWLIKKLRHSHSSAPAPASMGDILKELKDNGLVLKRKYKVMPLLSAEVVFLLEKNR